MKTPDLQRIDHIRDYCLEVRKTIERYGDSFEVFSNDLDYQRSVSFSILQIGELSKGLSDEFRNMTKNQVQWNAMKGMRNLVAHSYGSMNRRIIWETAISDIPALLKFCNYVLTNKPDAK